jgi:hypothetical protein
MWQVQKYKFEVTIGGKKRRNIQTNQLKTKQITPHQVPVLEFFGDKGRASLGDRIIPTHRQTGMAREARKETQHVYKPSKSSRCIHGHRSMGSGAWLRPLGRCCCCDLRPVIIRWYQPARGEHRGNTGTCQALVIIKACARNEGRDESSPPDTEQLSVSASSRASS